MPQMLLACIFLSLFSLLLSYILVHAFKSRMPLRGKDVHKNGDVYLPEAVGIGSGLAFIITLFFVLICVEKNRYFYNILAITSSCLYTILLGFIDDVLDLEWRYKLIFPAISIIPTILLYSEGTHVLIPFVGLTNIGLFYYIYMIICSIFSTNAINIYSGINGLEVVQTLVVSWFLFCDHFINQDKLGMTVTLVLFCTSLPLYYYNKYPARVFVGDTFCYFSGMALSCVSVLCHCTRTLFLLMGLQIVNFVLSLPQLTKFVECPRHRMPNFDGKYLVPSYAAYKGNKVINLTLLNLIILITGPIEEKELCTLLTRMQVVWCCLVIFIKHFMCNKVYKLQI